MDQWIHPSLAFPVCDGPDSLQDFWALDQVDQCSVHLADISSMRHYHLDFSSSPLSLPSVSPQLCETEFLKKIRVY
jgi:hypothetical protein